MFKKPQSKTTVARAQAGSADAPISAGTIKMTVSSIAFSQAKVSDTFLDGRTLDSVVKDLLNKIISAESIPTIRVVKYKGAFYSLDNRRLRIFKDAFITEIEVIICDLKDEAIKREFFQKKSNKSVLLGGEIRKRQETSLFGAMGAREHFSNGPYTFTKIVLGWTFEQLQVSMLHARDDITAEVEFRDRDDYYRRFIPLILEETRAMIQTGLELTTIEPLELLIDKAKIANNADNPSTIDFLKQTISVISVKAGDVFLLSHPEIPDLKCIAIANYVAPTEAQQRISFKVIIDPITRIINRAAFDKDVRWQARYVTSIITMMRMYDVCTSKPEVDFIDDLVTGQLHPVLNPALLPIYYQPPLKLNPSQQQAIEKFLVLESGVQLIQGPPGTGKTTTIVNLLQLLLQQNLRILVCAPSNKAVQVLADRFCLIDNSAPAILVGVEDKLPENNENLQKIFLHTWAQKIFEQLAEMRNAIWAITLEILLNAEFSLPALVEDFNDCVDTIQRYALLDGYDAESEKEHFIQLINSCLQIQCEANAIKFDAEKLTENLRRLLSALSVQLNTLEYALQRLELAEGGIEKVLLNKARIIFSTLSVAGRKSMQDMESVDVLIIDEASQAVEVEMLISLFSLPKKCLIIGDPKQLPATVISREAAQYGFERSLMVRLIENCRQEFSMLDTQYRMHPEISLWPSQQYYDGRLNDAAVVSTRDKIVLAFERFVGPYSFIHVESQEQRVGNSYRNTSEAQLIIKLLQHLQRIRVVDINTQVVIITFYAAQVQYINQQLERYGLGNIKAHTVDSFQGNEADVVLISCVRANAAGTVGFLNDFRRLNVAITRARHALIMFGDANTLAQARRADIANLVEDARERNCIFSAKELEQHCQRSVKETKIGSRKSQPVCQFFRADKPSACRNGADCRFQHAGVNSSASATDEKKKGSGAFYKPGDKRECSRQQVSKTKPDNGEGPSNYSPRK